MGRHSGFRQERDRLPRNGWERNGSVSAANNTDSSASRGPAVEHSKDESNGEFNFLLNGIEQRLASQQQDFTSAIHKINEKENEKFDLIFAILSELQQRQANLEESVRSLKAQYPNGNNTSQLPQQQAQFGSSGGVGQSYMGGQMNGNMGNQQPMQQQFAGVMQPDGTFVMQPQQMIIMAPPASGGMQYMAAPQMMTQTGAVVQQMPTQMAMQFIAQNCNEMGQPFAVENSQEGECQASGSSVQAQMDMIKPDNSAWQSESGSTIDPTQLDQRPVEAQGHNSSISGVGSSETSSQEGKVVDDASPCVA